MSRSKHPVQFGLNPRGLPFERVIAVARAAEAAGFTTVAFPDRPPEPNIEAWTIATAVACAMERIRVTHSTLNVPYRYPAMLGKMAASLDVITGGGRVVLTLGAGGQEGHARAYGVPFGAPGHRVDALIDTINIMRGMWTNASFTYAGKVHSIEECVVEPKPVNGLIPILIGAGKPRTLGLAGSLADGWIKNGGWPESPEAYAELQERVDRGAERAGRDPATLRRVVNCAAHVVTDGAASNPPTLGASGGLIGTAEEILETVERHREVGVDSFHVQFDNAVIDEQIPMFGEQVIAKLR